MNAVNNDANNQTNWPRRKEKKVKKNSANTRCQSKRFGTYNVFQL
jgi:hypothetical protein